MEFSTIALSLRKNCHGLQNRPCVLKLSLKWIANIYLKTFNLRLARKFQTSQFAKVNFEHLVSSSTITGKKRWWHFFVATKLCCYVHQIFVLKLKMCMAVNTRTIYWNWPWWGINKWSALKLNVSLFKLTPFYSFLLFTWSRQGIQKTVH